MAMSERTIGVLICCSIVAFLPHGHDDPFMTALVPKDMSYTVTTLRHLFFNFHLFTLFSFAVSLSAIFFWAGEMHWLVSVFLHYPFCFHPMHPPFSADSYLFH